ncbi:DUF2087 domain-containing protein [Paramaledivibacter caminithermalis]|jgi:DNA-binding CsgD family transcriptional regulator|uniref:DUF2087 domain-containing protein n=1 Tax=Paramaledivibacter caminithermalis (strain DSM 15212 / CIP 107654 / DViRD3) TaxID=1121301 RepID=A0A1M6R2X4_PARC5|nr:DUF2087 domain-containing protein [Paramaledivibacter caminithermalis]SHK26766.1 hypothetical protein SAMN02745912_02821 [Paramaledivibacter caminithermalis DSM 15212]
MNVNGLFWNATIDEIKQGYVYNSEFEGYICLICGEKFEKGVIYPQDNTLYDAERAVKKHIELKHGSVFNYLINMNKKYTGLTDVQKELLRYFNEGLSDKEIVKKEGGKSTSTIRNHRFRLKEKEKQAKVFLAIMALLENKSNKDEKLIDIHKGATMVDERYAITNSERESVIKRYFKDEGNGKLISFPRKEKRKIIVLNHISKKFKNNKEYTEKEVNDILKKVDDDYVTLRRYLIEYGFLNRTNDCSSYWVKN